MTEPIQSHWLDHQLQADIQAVKPQLFTDNPPQRQPMSLTFNDLYHMAIHKGKEHDQL